MDRDELLKSLLKGRKYQWSVEEQLNDILSLLAPAIEKARKGDEEDAMQKTLDEQYENRLFKRKEAK